MAKKSDKKQRKFSIYWLFGKIGDILFIPILVISLFSSISMLVQRQQNKPTSFFGISLVNVLSESMTSEGLLKGDTLIAAKTDVYGIELGDVIAFYNYRDLALDQSSKKYVIVKYNYLEGNKEVNTNYENIVDINKQNPQNAGELLDETLKSLQKQERSGEKTVQDAQKANAKIYFHMVIGIYYDDYGNVFYKTKGSDNNTSDDYIRSDFVVGKYVNTPRFLRDTMSFCASTKGMIILVCLPLSILVLLQCFSLIKQIEVMNYEKQLISGKRKFYDDEIIKSFNGNEMETHNKAYLYYLSPPDERDKLMQFVWEEAINQKASKKENNLYNVALDANSKLNTSTKEYWNSWINGTKGYTKRKIKKIYEEVQLSAVIENASKNQTEVKPTNIVPKTQEAKEQKQQNKEQLNSVISSAQNSIKKESNAQVAKPKSIKQATSASSLKQATNKTMLDDKNNTNTNSELSVNKTIKKAPNTTSVKTHTKPQITNTTGDSSKPKANTTASQSTKTTLAKTQTNVKPKTAPQTQKVAGATKNKVPAKTDAKKEEGASLSVKKPTVKKQPAKKPVTKPKTEN